MIKIFYYPGIDERTYRWCLYDSAYEALFGGDSLEDLLNGIHVEKWTKNPSDTPPDFIVIGEYEERPSFDYFTGNFPEYLI